MQKNTLSRKGIAIIVIVLFIGMSVVPISGTLSIKRNVILSSFGKTLYVGGSGPNNYTKIQDAIDNASDGDTVFVYDDSSPYYENVVVDKSINLIGEDRNTTVIDGGNNNDTVYVTADWVNMSGFTVQNSGDKGHPGFDSGIELNNVSNCCIERNLILDNKKYGIFIYNGSSKNMISGNSIIHTKHHGVCVRYASLTLITGNIITDSDDGIGITLGDGSKNNTVSDNLIRNNYYHGIYIGISFFNPGPHPYGNLIVNNILTGNNDGIFLICTHNNTVIENKIMNHKTFDGISLDLSSDNNISSNLIINNRKNGIILGGLYGSCNNNLIVGNTIFDNGMKGIWIDETSKNNVIYHNNLINNSINAVDNGRNIWDNGYPSGGNYWSDYSGVDNDADGIGDSPHPIPGGDCEDRYPLMEPYGILGPLFQVEVHGGLGLVINIKNVGDVDASKLLLGVHIAGGFLGLINYERSGVMVGLFSPGEEYRERILLLGFGPIEIVVTVSAMNAIEVTKTIKGFMFLFFAIIL